MKPVDWSDEFYEWYLEKIGELERMCFSHSEEYVRKYLSYFKWR